MLDPLTEKDGSTVMRKLAFGALILMVSITGCTDLAGSTGDPLLDELLAADIDQGVIGRCASSSPPTPTRLALGAVEMDIDVLQGLLDLSPGSNHDAFDAFPTPLERKLDVCLYRDAAVEDPNVFAIAVYGPSDTGDPPTNMTILNIWPGELIGD